MDLLRGGAVLLVIAHHLRLVQEIWDGAAPHTMAILSEGTMPFRMPALLFASGLLLERSLRKPAARYLSGKARSMLWPWLLWSALMLPILGWENAREPLWWINGMYTWFLLALFLYYLIGLLARRIHPGWLALASVAGWTAMPLLGLAQDVAGLRPDKFLYYAAFFFAGAAAHRVLAVRTVPWALILPSLVIAAGWAAYAVYLDADPDVPVLSQVVVLIGVLGAIGVAQHLPRIGIVRGIEWLGRNSIVPYLVHLPVIELLARHTDVPVGWPAYLAGFTIVIAICVLAIRLRPVTSFLYVFPGVRRGSVAGAAGSSSATVAAPVTEPVTASAGERRSPVG